MEEILPFFPFLFVYMKKKYYICIKIEKKI